MLYRDYVYTTSYNSYITSYVYMLRSVLDVLWTKFNSLKSDAYLFR